MIQKISIGWIFVLIAGYSLAGSFPTRELPGILEIRQVGEAGIRITLKPGGYREDLPYTPALADREYPPPFIKLSEIQGVIRKRAGKMHVEVHPDPLALVVKNSEGIIIQTITFHENGNLSFLLDEYPVLGLGEGGPRPERGSDWRNLPIEFDRRGRFHRMQPRWQSDAYGSRNPVPLLIGTRGWAIYVTVPWGQIDLTGEDRGIFIPIRPVDKDSMRQNRENQQQNLGKGIPPMDSFVPGLYDLFVFDAHDPAAFMKDLSLISGPAVMPPRWALGYMQSHRTLEDERQMISIVDSFRNKQIPLDAVIYLGTGFCPRGWNTEQPSFDFNPEVFERDPAEFIGDLHRRHVRAVLHIVPWDRDKLPTLHGTIPPAPGENVDAAHILSYWQQHTGLIETGVDAFWPDEGDWFDLFERMKRHQMYYQGPLYSRPGIRPWSLHRNGHLGVARWGGWIWSGDTQSAWKTLEGQIAVGINHSLSLSPYWGSDIGGFYPNEELTGELYARWYQFGAFCPSFRSHGRTWWTRLPWGWGLGERGPLETRTPPLESELNNPHIEPVAKKYTELRYRLLPYNYTLAWEARNTGMPLMRALWLHYPKDATACQTGDQYLWGRDILVAPVYEKGAVSRKVYLPEGEWFDWWTNEKISGGKTVLKQVDLSVMPLYVRAGAIIPFDPVRQYTEQPVDAPTTLRIYRGADGNFILYDDDGISQDYLQGEFALTRCLWDDTEGVLTIEPGGKKKGLPRTFRIETIPDGATRLIEWNGREKMMLSL
ncbi:MAG TPA: glycoside hydrolase family 31 protein [Bacteroidetes bacterium]|nr:glycoside hydrolase family 31 protein [Bacteroidota bacterium]